MIESVMLQWFRQKWESNIQGSVLREEVEVVLLSLTFILYLRMDGLIDSVNFQTLGTESWVGNPKV
jgi:hypothetical protein